MRWRLSAGQQFGTNRSVFSPRPITIRSYVDDHQRGEYPFVPLPSSLVLAMSTPSRSKSKVRFKSTVWDCGCGRVGVYSVFLCDALSRPNDEITRRRCRLVVGHQLKQTRSSLGLVRLPLRPSSTVLDSSDRSGRAHTDPLVTGGG